MKNSDYEALIAKLLAKSEKKEADWQKTSRSNEFILSLDVGTLTIDSSESSGGYSREDAFHLAIFNKKGERIGTYSAERGCELFGILENLHTAARDCYYKADETLADMLGELDRPGLVGKDPPKPTAVSGEEVPF